MALPTSPHEENEDNNESQQSSSNDFEMPTRRSMSEERKESSGGLPTAKPTGLPSLPVPKAESWIATVRNTNIEGEEDFVKDNFSFEPEESHDHFPTMGARKLLPVPEKLSKDRKQYVSTITSETLKTTPYSKWEHLEPVIEELTGWLQSVLSDEEMTDSVRRARVERDETREDTLIKLDSFLLRKLAGDRTLKEHKGYVISRVINEIIGLGPLEPLWEDPSITEIIVQGPNRILIEVKGTLKKVPGIRFRNNQHLNELAKQILMPLNRSLDINNPLENGRLAGLSRVHLVHNSLSPLGDVVTIRRHREEAWTVKDLVNKDSFSEEMARDLAFWIHSGLSTVVVGGTGTGKALSLSTPIPTPQGLRTMGELAVNDEVFDHNGQITKITGVYDQGLRPSYRVSFSDGSSVIADAEHNWLTYTRAARRAVSRAIKQERRLIASEVDINALKAYFAGNTEELISFKDIQVIVPHLKGFLQRISRSITHQKVGARGTKFYFAKDIEQAVLSKCALHRNDQRHRTAAPTVVTTKEIKDTLFTSTGHKNHAIKRLEQPVEWDISVTKTLSDSDLFNTENLHKDLLLTSVNDRKRFLEYYSDVKGVKKGERVAFKNDSLSDSDKNILVQVISSLGYIAHKNDSCVFYIDVKNSVSNRNAALNTYRYITDIELLDEEEEMRCISVDSEEKLYLCSDDFIPTHNTTVLNALSGLIPEHDNIITIEDNLELQLHPDRFVTPLEARAAGTNEKSAITIRDLVKASLRMRPDRIVVGEVRDAAAYDMLQAMNTGHNGSMTTFHANGAAEAIQRLEVMVGQSGEINSDGVKFLIAGSVDLMVIVTRYPEDGSRRVSGIYEVPNRVAKNEDEVLGLEPIPLWEFEHTHTLEDGTVQGRHVKKNEISNSAIAKHRLDRKKTFSIDEVYDMSNLKGE